MELGHIIRLQAHHVFQQVVEILEDIPQHLYERNRVMTDYCARISQNDPNFCLRNSERKLTVFLKIIHGLLHGRRGSCTATGFLLGFS